MQAQRHKRSMKFTANDESFTTRLENDQSDENELEQYTAHILGGHTPALQQTNTTILSY